MSNNSLQPATLAKRSVLVSTCIALFLAGFTFIFLENIFPEQRPVATQIEAINLLSDSAIQQTNYSRSELEIFVLNGGRAWQGIVLYPRYYNQNDGEGAFGNHEPLFLGRPYSRVAFYTLSQNGLRSVVLPSDVPEYFPHFATATIIGCQDNVAKYEGPSQAILVIFEEAHQIVSAQPNVPLACPLPEIICDNNKSCNVVP